MDRDRGTNIGGRGPEAGSVDGGGSIEQRPPHRRSAQGVGSDGVARPDNFLWGAIAAGALAVVGAFLLLGLLALGLGLLADASGTNDWVSAIIGIIAFFVGGYVAGRALDHRRDGSRGLLNALLSWALATVIILVLSGLGMATLFAPVGDMMGPLAPERIVEVTRTVALGAWFTLLLWAIASALGGWLGEKS